MLEVCKCEASIKTIFYSRVLVWRQTHYCGKNSPVDTESNTEITPKYDYEEMITPIIGFTLNEKEENNE